VKDVIVIGGPNGAGKTTAANRLLPTALELREFLNADEIARGLSPFDPEANGSCRSDDDRPHRQACWRGKEFRF
jgi:predicted ABC-type ATPase